MFSSIGNFAHKYRFFILAGWVILTAVLVLTAPSLSEVGVTDQSKFLPQNTESSIADDLLNTKFASVSEEASSGIIVVYNENGLSQDDYARAKEVRDWLDSKDAPTAVSGTTSIFDSEALRSSLISQDGTTMLMMVKMSASALDNATKQAIEDIRAQLGRYSGTSFYFTGNDGLQYDQFNSIQQSIDRTTLATIILVIILLLLVYRSPLAPLVPLIAIGCSFLVSRGIIGFLAQSGVAISTLSDAFLVVIIFGVGTDYCLFMISRFREGLGDTERKKLTATTMERIGPIILASAVTVIIALLCLSISRFGMARTTGWALAIGIAVTLLAGLTLVPALMSIFGNRLFWPMKVSPAIKPGKFGWNKIGQWIVDHPALTAIPIILVLAVPYLALPKLSLTANILSQMPDNVESARGIDIVREKFPVGELSPLYLVIQSNDGSLLNPASLRELETAAQSLNDIDSIARVDYFSAPSRQLIEKGAQVHSLADRLAGSNPPLNELASLQSFSGELTDLVVRYPGITQSLNFQITLSDLNKLSTALSQVSSTQPSALAAILPQAQALLNDLGDALTSLGNEFELQGNSPFVEWLRATYFSTDGTIARVDLILAADPYSNTTVALIDGIREDVSTRINASNLNNTTHYIGGETAVYSDMLQINNADFIRVMIITSIGILLVIIILLRSLLAPLYMVLTVLLNFGTTLGISVWLFLDVLKSESLINMLPILVFVVLVAVGADYNIFLVSRIREETRDKSIKEAVQHGVAHTGGVITSCGIILAGTFATMATSSLPAVLQIGVPIAIGVIVDTFLVRALLVPALVTIGGRWSWWPSRLSRK